MERKTMKQFRLSLIAILGFALIVTVCTKKSADQASLQGTGFETATTEDLAQLPQANNSSNQQAGIEVLPIETSPVTQGIPVPNPAMMATSRTRALTATAALSRDEQIQTALKNA